MPREKSLSIASTWDGVALGSSERVALHLSLTSSRLTVVVEAPFHDDPPPPGAAGPTEGLWDHEVVELFLLGDNERYLEIELGPHGHHLVLQLRGVRQRVASALPIAYDAEISEGIWRGTATASTALLPPGALRINAYAIHGEGKNRRHLAMQPVPGAAPDFHRLDAFVPLDW